MHCCNCDKLYYGKQYIMFCSVLLFESSKMFQRCLYYQLKRMYLFQSMVSVCSHGLQSSLTLSDLIIKFSFQ